MARHPITYLPVPTQRQFEINRVQIKDRPYAHYFNGDLWVHDTTLPALSGPIAVEDALPETAQGFNRLLEPGYLPAETGYCELPNGSAYVASLVPFPGCTGEMLSWWFWWHAVEPPRYTLWYPHNHIAAVPLDPGALTKPGLSHQERYVGTSHRVQEYIGADKLEIIIRFVDPAEMGVDTSRFTEAGIVAHACAYVYQVFPRARIVTMLHLARQTDDGFELRSRYWIGNNIRSNLLGLNIGMSRLLSRIGLLRKLTGARMGYEQLLHDQIEFTHLSTFLAPIYNEFGSTP